MLTLGQHDQFFKGIIIQGDDEGNHGAKSKRLLRMAVNSDSIFHPTHLEN